MNVRADTRPRGESDLVTLQDFFDHLRYSNPFLSGQVSDPWGAAVDVATIHDAPFRDLVRGAELARHERTGLGVVVWGEAGIGKSHLLARLCRWAEQKDEEGRDRALYVFLHNVQTAPERLPRYVLKCVLSRLTLGRPGAFHGTPLYWLVTGSLKKALAGFPIAGELPSADEARWAFLRMADRLTRENRNLGADARSVFEVLFRFFLGAYKLHRLDGDEREARLAVRWLSGEELDQEETGRLGLAPGRGPDEPAALPDEQAIHTVLVVLAELAANRGQSFLLCFDQVDNLSDGQIQALAQFQHTLIDHARNLLVVTSGVKSKLLEVQQSGTILTAAWARIAQQELTLSRIGPAQARQVLEARLENWVEPFMAISEIKQRVQSAPLFPLGTEWLEVRLGDLIEFRPRDVINWARQQWRRQQALLEETGGPHWLRQWSSDAGATVPPYAQPPPLSEAQIFQAIDEKVDRKVREQIARRELEPAELPPDAGNLAGLAEFLLAKAATPVAADTGETEEHGGVEGWTLEEIRRLPPGVGKRRRAYDLTIRTRDRTSGNESTVAVAFVLTANATSTTFALRRIVQDAAPPDRVLVVTDQRQPLRLGPRGKEHLAELEGRGPGGFCHLELTFIQYAELDALAGVAGDARSGDLELDLPGGGTRPVTEQEVIASHSWQRRLRRHALLEAVLSAGSVPGSTAPSPSGRGLG